MDTLHTLNGKPIGSPTAAPAAPVIPVGNPTVTATGTAAQVLVHRAECGEAGVVGEVGELGSNAK